MRRLLDRTGKLAWGPWVFFAMFGVVILANGVMVLFAMTSWTGLETRGAYEKGLAYNQTLQAERDQEALGWQVEIGLTAEGAGPARIEARFRDRDGRPVKPEAVTAWLIRPTHEGYDLTVPLHAESAGHYGTEVELPLAGQWDLRVLAEHGGGIYQAQRRVVVP
jgi:nitrogen fixation protein FixH